MDRHRIFKRANIQEKSKKPCKVEPDSCVDFSDSFGFVRTDLWCSKPEPCEPKPSKPCKPCEPCEPKPCKPKKQSTCNDLVVECSSDPIKADICVEKNLLTVCRIPLASAVEFFVANGNLPPSTYFSQLLLTYEIVLINKTAFKISDINIYDTLAGLTFVENSIPFTNSIEIVKCPGHIVLYETDEIAYRKGQLNDPDASYLPPNSVTTIVVKLAMGAPEGTICEVRYVQNSVSVEGILEKSTCKNNKVYINKHPIVPIVEKSHIWKTKSDFTFLVGIFVPL